MRKRNANGMLVVGGPRSGQGSRLATNSPIGPPTSSSPFAGRRDQDATADVEMDDDSDENDEPLTLRHKSPPLGRAPQHVQYASAPEAAHSRFASMPSSTSLGGRSEGGLAGYATPQNLKNVKPLQAAFMSTGLITKRARASLDGGPIPTAAALASPFGKAGPSSFNSFSPVAAPTLSFIAAAPTKAPTLEMPDTPCKPSTAAGLLSPAAMPPTPVVRPGPSPLSPARRDGLARTDSVMSTGSSSSSSSFVGSPTGRSTTGIGGSPTLNLASVARSTTDSVPMIGSPHGRRITLGLRRVGAPLFRRRSSGQLAIEAGSGSLTKIIDDDATPMTPTRVSSGDEDTDDRQLVTSPVTPATSIPPLSAGLTTPYGARTGADHHRPQPSMTDWRPTASFPPPAGGRPTFRHRHSGSVLHALRQQEIQSPDRFEARFVIVRSIGAGEFSNAFAVRDREDGQLWAVKRTKHAFGGPKDRCVRAMR